jgi:hypothetical protein
MNNVNLPQLPEEFFSFATLHWSAEAWGSYQVRLTTSGAGVLGNCQAKITIQNTKIKCMMISLEGFVCCCSLPELAIVPYVITVTVIYHPHLNSIIWILIYHIYLFNFNWTPKSHRYWKYLLFRLKSRFYWCQQLKSNTNSLAVNVGDMSQREMSCLVTCLPKSPCCLVYGDIVGTQDCQSRVWPCHVTSDRH